MVVEAHQGLEVPLQSATSRKPKSLRKLLSQKLGFSKHADRVDASTSRDSNCSHRDQPVESDVGEERDLPAVEEREISALNDKGNDFFAKGEFDAALRMYSEALKLLKNPRITMDMEFGSEDQEDLSKGMRRFRTARLLVNIGAVHIRRENYDEAISVLEMSMRSSKLVPVQSSYYYRSCEVMADALENIGLVLYKLKTFEESSTRYADALVARRKCIELLTDRFMKQKGPKSNEAVAKYRQEVSACKIELANTLFYMALLRERQGKIDEAIMRCEESILLQKEIYPQLKSDTTSVNLFTTMGRLYCHESIQRYEDALEYFYEVRRMKSQIFGSMHIEVASSLNNIAYIYLRLGEFEKCLSLSENAIDIADNGRGITPEVCVAWTHKADAQERMERHKESISSYEKVLHLQSSLMGDKDIANAAIFEKIADVNLTTADVKAAIASLEKAIVVKRAALGDESCDLARTYRKLGECFEMTQSFANAINCHTKALRIFKHNEDKEGAAVQHNKLGGILKLSGDSSKSMEHYMASLWHAREAKLPSTNPIVADTIRNVASFQTN
ncbi:hypothetical protein ACHAW6_006493 [Cyclotella cf. meneghiniana]